uniref:AlNc14C15G1710 protein n=1 Tax=Albugo laibachii Nc14 TaxID=890382 RepID=F0W423_9STRA|nr:AlNc14C15G1710 [Albugo laibachii Nc14]|eukprot:CCA15820.1 AlNc14C15G1710 [Albugo laibachii Nc14]
MKVTLNCVRAETLDTDKCLISVVIPVSLRISWADGYSISGLSSYRIRDDSSKCRQDSVISLPSANIRMLSGEFPLHPRVPDDSKLQLQEDLRTLYRRLKKRHDK